jgi:glutamine synthetase
MSDWTKNIPEAARDYVSGRRLDEVECILPDIAGVARGKAMPALKFDTQASFYLPTSIFLQTITGDWADSPKGPDEYKEPDMTLVPDFSTTTAAPWTADITLQIIHDAVDQRGTPVETAPRNVLKRVLALYAAKGWKPVVAPEMEFFFVARNLDPNMPIEPPMGRSGRRAAAKQAYSMSAVDEYGKVIDDIYDFAEAMGLEIDGILQEGGAGQVEINLAHGDPVRLADQIFYFKRMIREAALRQSQTGTGSALFLPRSEFSVTAMWRGSAKLSISTAICSPLSRVEMNRASLTARWPSLRPKSATRLWLLPLRSDPAR